MAVRVLSGRGDYLIGIVRRDLSEVATDCFDLDVLGGDVLVDVQSTDLCARLGASAGLDPDSAFDVYGLSAGVGENGNAPAGRASRQAQITQEISEIVGGADALVTTGSES